MRIAKPNALFALLLLLWAASPAIAQESGSGASAPYGGIQATPKHAWEIGLHGGHFFSAGDLDFTPSYGAGFHLRRALDYVFSLRIDGQYGLAKGDSQNGGYRYNFNGSNDLYDYETTYASLTLQGVVSLNNLRWDTPRRKVNIYALVGGGPAYISTAMTSKASGRTVSDVEIPGGRQTGNFVPTVEAGLGMGFRISEGFNIAIEHKAASIFGQRADLVDGFDSNSWRDIINYTNLRFNFNLRGGGKRSEPLYWVNPLDVILNDISELKARPALDLTDTDGDGVIDMFDADPNTPPGVAVDVRGVPLDSDGDGIPDYMDDEPFSAPGQAVDSRGRALAAPGQEVVTRDEVNKMIQQAINNDGSGTIGGGGGGGRGAALADWFLPMIHFGNDSYRLRHADYGNLANIATVLKNNPKMKVVVRGYTDKTGSESYNQVLSYRRAEAALNHLVNAHGIPREQLILQYGGTDNALVPTSSSNLINRRVEFRVASPEDKEMPAPSGAGSSNFQGQRDAGY
jgi:OOP family OmpA-OmpF porin